VRITLACLITSTLLAAQTARAEQPLATPAEIDRACNAAEKHADKHKKEARLFAEVTPDQNARSMWRSFPSASALEHATSDGPPHEQAFVAPGATGVVFVELFSTSPSGDWAQFADLCYRPDGSLARAVDTLNTFYDDGTEGRGVSRVHTLHFDTAGKVISKRSKLLDLQTRKSVKRLFRDQDDRIFLRLTDLPFSALLSEAAQ